jgi:asparagine synthase (glutamine-hydrolysing)
MCGFAGVVDASGRVRRSELCHSVQAMADAIRHRGPDDAGSWLDDAAPVALSFRRLAILDLTDAGHQPQLSHDGRFAIVFNGEIYNHLDLRSQLSAEGEKVAWRGHSDTETLLACFSAWGVKQTLEHTVGMFALAMWDRGERRLHLARDRFGEKPL